jgi:predicted RNA-binding protein with PIN domain
VLVFVDANNVRRSRWPNLTDDELVDRVRAWGERHGHELVIVFDREAPGGVAGTQRLDERTTVVGSGRETADEWLIGEVPAHPGAWLVTSDRALREAAGGSAGRVIGSGSFLRELDD